MLTQTAWVSKSTQNHHRSRPAITDQNGAVTTRKDYTAFGEVNYTSQRVTSLGYDASAEKTAGTLSR